MSDILDEENPNEKEVLPPRIKSLINSCYAKIF